MSRILFTLILVMFSVSLNAATIYVDLNSSSPTPPYSGWPTAADDLQAAIDYSSNGDTVIVASGTYDDGHTDLGCYTRIVVDKPITVVSANGPATTFIKGRQKVSLIKPIRCLYLTNGAVFVGFTLTNGFSAESGDAVSEQSGGGAWCEPDAVLSNCVITGCDAEEWGGGVYQGRLYACEISGNVASEGAGVAYGVCIASTSCNNSASSGGGFFQVASMDCMIVSNRAQEGGGTFGGTNINASIVYNSGGDGGGTFGSENWNTLLKKNKANAASGNIANSGGGASESTNYNCYILQNEANMGGGTYLCENYNCTIVDNRAVKSGGSYVDKNWNCIVYYNYAYANDQNTYFSDSYYSCLQDVSSRLTNGTTAAPNLAGLDNPHLLPISGCVGTGTNMGWMAGAKDFLGNDRILDGQVDMGCVEYNAGTATGALFSALAVSTTNVIPDFPLLFTVHTEGQPTRYDVTMEDGTVFSNECMLSHAFAQTGSYDVQLRSVNNEQTNTAFLTMNVLPGFTNYVSQQGSHSAPFLSLSTGATNIQAAIDANTVAGGVVLVNTGVYASGSTVVIDLQPSRVAITNPLTLRSLHGPEDTFIEGRGTPGPTAIRCVYACARSRVEGFTLTNGATLTYGDSFKELAGGGIWCESSAVVSNCIITGNSASQYGGGMMYGTGLYCRIAGNSSESFLAGFGAGAAYCTLSHCELIDNEGQYGGGAAYVDATDCTFSNNLAKTTGGGQYHGTCNRSMYVNNRSEENAGGLASCVATNCLIADNVSENEGGGVAGGTYLNCTIVGNQADYQRGGASAATLINSIVYSNTAIFGSHNVSNCIASYVCTTPLQDGVGNITNWPAFVDYATRNLQLPTNSPCIDAGTNDTQYTTTDLLGIPRPLDGNDDGIAAPDMGAYETVCDAADSDGDAFHDGDEFVAGTSPVDPASFFELLEPGVQNGGIVMEWETVTGRLYGVLSCSNLVSDNWVTLPGYTNLPGTGAMLSITNELGSTGSAFYRLEVKEE